MGIIAFIVLCACCFVAYLVGYCAGAQDKAKEITDKWKLTL